MKKHGNSNLDTISYVIFGVIGLLVLKYAFTGNYDGSAIAVIIFGLIIDGLVTSVISPVIKGFIRTGQSAGGVIQGTLDKNADKEMVKQDIKRAGNSLLGILYLIVSGIICIMLFFINQWYALIGVLVLASGYYFFIAKSKEKMSDGIKIKGIDERLFEVLGNAVYEHDQCLDTNEIKYLNIYKEVNSVTGHDLLTVTKANRIFRISSILMESVEVNSIYNKEMDCDEECKVSYQHFNGPVIKVNNTDNITDCVLFVSDNSKDVETDGYKACPSHDDAFDVYFRETGDIDKLDLDEIMKKLKLILCIAGGSMVLLKTVGYDYYFLNTGNEFLNADIENNSAYNASLGIKEEVNSLSEILDMI